MKKIRLLGSVFLLSFIYIVLNSSSAGRATAANDDKTGAAGQTCGSCHSGGSYGTVTTTIQAFAQGTTNAVTSYTAGTVYDIKVTISNTTGTPVGYGFEFTCLTTPGNAAVANVYTNLSSNTKQKLVTTGTFNGRRYTEHSGVSASNIFTFSWTAPAAGTGSVKFYAAGVCVNGANQDNGDKASAGTTLTLTESVSTPLSVTGTVTNVSCSGGSNGAITITPAGGTSPYTYNWGGGVTTQNITNIAAGTYTVTVTDNTSSTSTATFTVTQPTALTVSGTTTNILCSGNSTGAINITASGGTTAYTYNWGSGITTEDRTNIAAGTYNVTVTDNHSCTATATYTITQPTALSASNTHGTVSCFGGNTTITVSGSGGTSPYIGTGTFTVTAGNYNYTITDANNCTATTSVNITQPTQLSASANNITIPCSGGSGTVTVSASGGTAPYTGTGSFTETTPGIKTYTVNDSKGCTATATSTVSSASGLSVNGNVTSLACNGICSGSVTTTITGGTAPYSYNWSNNVSTQNINNLCAGTYIQTVSDNANCSMVNTFVVNDVPALQASAVVDDSVNCYGGIADISAVVTGGTSPYLYLWSNSTSTVSTSLLAGVYALTITDANSCTAAFSGVISQPDSIAVSVINVTNDNGTGNGAIDISVVGGISPYTFAWSNASITEDIAGLSSGLYSVTVADANGCSKSFNNISIINTDIPNTNNETVRIYPNPFNASFNVYAKEETLLSIYSTDGILQKQLPLAKGLNHIDAVEIAAGLYIADVKTESGVIRMLLIKTE